MRQTFRPAPQYRSLLFIPGHKLEWMLKAPKYQADALILDLEDAVPSDEKQAARALVAEAVDQLRDKPLSRFVRVNAWGGGLTPSDVRAVVRPGLDGIMLAKAEDVEDIVALDFLLTDLEIEQGLTPGAIEIFPLIETARAMYRHFEICSASERVRRSGGVGNAVRGDQMRALDLHFSSDDADEALFTNARSGLEARAAGVTQIVGGMTDKLDDPELVRRLAQRARALGASGAMAIHPGYVPILNEVFAPSTDEIEHARGVVEAMSEAMERGDAATRFQGALVDIAHVRLALQTLETARAIGMDVGEVPELSISSS